MGGELLEGEGIHEGDDRNKPQDDQDICQDTGGAQEEDGPEGQGRSLVEVLATTVGHYFPFFNEGINTQKMGDTG